MTNESLKALIEKVATEVGCGLHYVALRFQSYEASQEPSWACDVACSGKIRTKSYRPPFMGSGDTAEAAVTDLLASNRYREWKDPAGLAAEKALKADIETFDGLLHDGAITLEQYERLVANRKAKQ